MMKSNVFEIKGLGIFQHLANIKTIDFPRTFVCKELNKKNDIRLFIFDEYENEDDHVSWACSQISFEEFDRLNQGIQSIEKCFVGPFGSDKEGYLIRNNTGEATPFVQKVSSMPQKVCRGETFSETFIEECHGAGPLSLVYGKKIASIVLDNNRYCNPMFTNSILSNNASKIKAMLSSLPYSITTKNSLISLSYAHSLVLNVIVSSNDDDDNELGFDVKSESDEAFDALKTIMSRESTENEIINAFRSKTDAIKKFDSFMNSFNTKILNNNPIVQLVDANQKKSTIIPISENVKDVIVNKNKECAEKLVQSEKEEQIFSDSGSFLMYDNTGKRGFKFKSDLNDDIYKGFCVFDEDSLENGITIKKKKYNIKVKIIVFKGDFGTSKPQREIIGVEEAGEAKQLHLKF